VLLSVWSFNLHQKQNSVTASLFFAALLGGGFAVPSETIFKPLPLGVCGGFVVLSEKLFKLLPLCPVCKCNRFFFVDLLCVYLCSFKRNNFLNLCRFAWSFANAIDFPLCVCLFAL
jgi:hypothetical protein